METVKVDTLGNKMLASMLDAVIEKAGDSPEVVKTKWKEPDPRFNRATQAAWDIIWGSSDQLQKLRKSLEESKVEEEQDQLRSSITETSGKIVLKAHEAFEKAWTSDPPESAEKILDDYKRALWDEDKMTALRGTFRTEARKALLVGYAGAVPDKSVSKKITVKKAVAEIILEKAGIDFKDVSLSKKTAAPTKKAPSKIGTGSDGKAGKLNKFGKFKDTSLSKKISGPKGKAASPIGTASDGYLGAWATAGQLIGEDKSVGGRVKLGKAFRDSLDLVYIEKMDIDHEQIMLSDYGPDEIFDHAPEGLWDEIEKAKYLDRIKLPSGGWKYIYERAKRGARDLKRQVEETVTPGGRKRKRERDATDKKYRQGIARENLSAAKKRAVAARKKGSLGSLLGATARKTAKEFTAPARKKVKRMLGQGSSVGEIAGKTTGAVEGVVRSGGQLIGAKGRSFRSKVIAQVSGSTAALKETKKRLGAEFRRQKAGFTAGRKKLNRPSPGKKKKKTK